MRRLLFVPLSLAIVGALALPAQAKGPVESGSGQIVITGPGLSRPIELKGTVRGFQEPGDGFMPFESRSDGEFTALLFASAMLSGYGVASEQYEGWYVLPPKNLRSLGPAYQLRFEMSGENWSESVTRQLYPFAPERALVFTPAESVRMAGNRVTMQKLRGLWWSAPPVLLSILQSHGLPKTAPPLAEPPPATAPIPPEHPQGWLLLWTALALLGLLAAGVIAGRRRMRLV